MVMMILGSNPVRPENRIFSLAPAKEF